MIRKTRREPSETRSLIITSQTLVHHQLYKSRRYPSHFSLFFLISLSTLLFWQAYRVLLVNQLSTLLWSLFTSPELPWAPFSDYTEVRAKILILMNFFDYREKSLWCPFSFLFFFKMTWLESSLKKGEDYLVTWTAGSIDNNYIGRHLSDITFR